MQTVTNYVQHKLMSLMFADAGRRCKLLLRLHGVLLLMKQNQKKCKLHLHQKYNSALEYLTAVSRTSSDVLRAWEFSFKSLAVGLKL